MDTLHPADLNSERLLAQCGERRQRRSGPGGQHRNKVETAVVLRHLDSGVQAEASERRSQQENRQVALFRLRLNLALQIRKSRPAPQVPSPLWQSRCRDNRITINPKHADFPSLLAEALDVLQQHGFDHSSAAQALNCTPSQLVKLLKLEPRALEQANQKRAEVGRHALK